ncbi:YigZ family protein [Ruminococcus sp.]|uniref:YigZ family protein n=1 Tax=Ruminococcus sp. TaxID=41978 RepID=UPI0025F14E0D|nr:YigZ family protein [Ruminococcus sp.]MCI6616039.1 YigZ family protein [Ruminococcus sp.]
MIKDYKTVQNESNSEFTEKRSRFIGYCKPVTTEQEAVDFINSKRSEHWNATHNVYAYSLREGNIKRYSDDGEPSGTAGMPVLDVITKNEIYDVCIVVTRYFGGVLLGTGGLVRAYSQGAKVALDAGNVVMMQSCLMCQARCSYNQYGKVSSLIMEIGATIDDTVYEADVLIKFHIKPEYLDKLNKQLADATSGEIQAVSDSEKYFMSEVEK